MEFRIELGEGVNFIIIRESMSGFLSKKHENLSPDVQGTLIILQGTLVCIQPNQDCDCLSKSIVFQ
jgi:hypothetical protein